MRLFLTLSLLLGACAGSQTSAKTPDDAQDSFAQRTKDRWTHEEDQREVESRRNQFTSNSAQRGDLQAQP